MEMKTKPQKTSNQSNDGVDKHGVRYFCDHNGSRVDYPTGTRFADGYVQPRIATLREQPAPSVR